MNIRSGISKTKRTFACILKDSKAKRNSVKRTPLKRSTKPIRKRKPRDGDETIGKTGRIRLRGKKLEALRRERFEKDRYRCQWDGCGKLVEWSGPNAGHLAHIQSRGAGGSDTLENTRTLCGFHHMYEHQHGRSSEGNGI